MARRKIWTAGQPRMVVGDVDFNHFTESAVLHIRANTQMRAAKNAPGDRAGLLEVHQDADFIYQRFTEYEASAVYVRGYYGWNDKWTDWKKIAFV